MLSPSVHDAVGQLMVQGKIRFDLLSRHPQTGACRAPVGSQYGADQQWPERSGYADET